MLNPIKKIAIAIDPLNEPIGHLQSVKQAINWFAATLEEIQFVSVLNASDLGSPLSQQITDQIENRVLEHLEKRLFSLELGRKFEIKLLVHKNSSKSGAVHQFLDYVSENDIDLVIAHSHTKSIFKDSLGSFCHYLTVQAKIPLLVLSMDGKLSNKISSVLYPTDFSELSKKVYVSVINLARDLKSRLSVYHRQSRPADELLQILMHPAEARTVLPIDLLFLSEEDLQKKTKEWGEIAKASQCEVDVVMNFQQVTLVTAILEQAHVEGADMIVIPTHTSFVNVTSIGHVPQHLIRKSSIPVLVVPVPYTSPGEWRTNEQK